MISERRDCRRRRGRLDRVKDDIREKGLSEEERKGGLSEG